jgi:predicted RNA-binding protein with RPS1 domain
MNKTATLVSELHRIRILQQTAKKTSKDIRLKKRDRDELVLSLTALRPPSVGDLVEGPVIGIEKSAIYINLNPYGTGIIFGREFIAARDIIKKINIGDNVGAKVVDTNNAEGYIELSLKEAKQALIWSEATDAIRDRKIFDLADY